MIPSGRQVVAVLLVTAAAMWTANQLAAMNPQARRLLKGSPVVPVRGMLAQAAGT